IDNYQAQFERFLKCLKIDGFEELGYAKKSSKMTTCLRCRSSVVFVYVSPKSLFKRSIVSRDMTDIDDKLR
ncbi:MAG: hypothetical protein EXX96DRAFT_483150, partial [Benjaminiella poitrasii]